MSNGCSCSSKANNFALKARLQLPISDQFWSYLALFQRYGDLKAENRIFSTSSHLTPSLGVKPIELLDEHLSLKNYRAPGLYSF